MSEVVVEIELGIRTTAGQDISYDDCTLVVEQLCHDALQGTFGRIRWASLNPISEMYRSLRYEQRNGRTAIVTFDLLLPGALLPEPYWLIQHVVGILAGDLVPARVGDYEVTSNRVNRIDLARDIEHNLVQAFRNDRANSIPEVRRRFRLPEGKPLLAYAFKPRGGLSIGEARRLVLGVLEAGFNYVVLDTRNVDFTAATKEPWLDLIAEAADLKRGHVTAFSPNLSMPILDLLPLVEDLLSRYPAGSPPTLKIDGGLDGISSIQAVRRTFPTSDRPVISSYPLLRRAFQPYLPNSTFAHLLGLSGADIVYPGGRPLLPHERRPIWAEEAAAIKRSVGSYRSIIRRGWPMPLMAGGVHPGQLHVLYELFGPDVGIFVGGAVALHRGGAIAGAQLCVNICTEAVRIAERANGQASESMLSSGLVRELESAYEDVEYLPPVRVLSSNSRLQRWYESS